MSVVLARLRREDRVWSIEAWGGYGVVVPNWATTNGSAIRLRSTHPTPHVDAPLMHATKSLPSNE